MRTILNEGIVFTLTASSRHFKPVLALPRAFSMQLEIREVATHLTPEYASLQDVHVGKTHRRTFTGVI